MQNWIDLNGRVVCKDHLGSYATAALARKPNVRSITTPLTVWERLEPQEVKELLSIFGIEEGIVCEDCSYDAKSKENK